MLNTVVRRAFRLRLGMVLISTTLVLGAGGLAPIHASAATTTRALTFISKTFPVNDYQGSILTSRGIPGSSVQFSLALTKTETGPTTDAQMQNGAETDVYSSTWKSGKFTAPTSPRHPSKMLASGEVDSAQQMGAFGSFVMTISSAGKLVHRSSCGDKIDTFSRPVQLSGTFAANPDSPTAAPYFGTVTETGFSGRLTFVINRKGGNPCKPIPQICAGGAALGYIDSTNPAVIPLWAAGNVTLSGTTTYVFAGFVVDQTNPNVLVLRLLGIVTPDATWFTSQPDLTAAHADTGVLAVPTWVTGATDYTYNGTAASSQPSTCGGVSYTSLTTNGTLSAPISFTFDGGGSFGNVAAGSGTLQSAAATASASQRRAVRVALRGSPAMRSLFTSTLRRLHG